MQTSCYYDTVPNHRAKFHLGLGALSSDIAQQSLKLTVAISQLSIARINREGCVRVKIWAQFLHHNMFWDVRVFSVWRLLVLFMSAWVYSQYSGSTNSPKTCKQGQIDHKCDFMNWLILLNGYNICHGQPRPGGYENWPWSEGCWLESQSPWALTGYRCPPHQACVLSAAPLCLYMWVLMHGLGLNVEE